jgi:hypothetical protein
MQIALFRLTHRSPYGPPVTVDRVEVVRRRSLIDDLGVGLISGNRTVMIRPASFANLADRT